METFKLLVTVAAIGGGTTVTGTVNCVLALSLSVTIAEPKPVAEIVKLDPPPVNRSNGWRVAHGRI